MSFLLTFFFPYIFKAAYASSCSCLVVCKGEQQVLDPVMFLSTLSPLMNKQN